MRCYRFFVILFIVLVGATVSAVNANFFLDGDSDFDIDSALLKLVVSSKDGESKSIVKNLKIASYKDSKFSIVKNNLDFIDIEENLFFIKEGEEKNIDIIFNTSGLDYGVYCGELLIRDGGEFAIPVVMELESEDVLFDGNINVPLDYVDVYAGDQIVVENKIFNLENIGSQNVKVSYFVKGFDGKTIFSDEENIAVESQILNTKVVPIPEDSKEGNYLFVATVQYKDSVGTSSYLFSVKEKTKQDEQGFFLWVAIAILIGLLFIIIHYNRKSDAVLSELQKGYQKEISKNADAVKKEKTRALRLDKKKRKIAMKKIKIKNREKTKAAKKIYKSRLKTIRHLRKANKENELSKKLKQWERQGYNIKEIVGGKKKRIGDSAKQYKKEGYNL